MAAKRFGRIAEWKDLTEPDKLITRCGRRFVNRYQMCQNMAVRPSKKVDPIIRSPRFGDEELPWRTPHQRWSHGVEKSDVQEAFNVSR